jgi:hypothetical protein
MGFDYSNHHVFSGDDSAYATREAVVRCISSLSAHTTTTGEDADRSIVVGPPTRWIFVGDSAGSTEDADPSAFDSLSNSLSFIAPTLSVKMSDSAIVHLLLYEHGRLVDKFGNGKFPWFYFQSAEESEPFRGDVARWKRFLLSIDDADALREVWTPRGDACAIVEQTARLFGIHRELMQCGYSVFDESDEIKYSDWLDEETRNGMSFDEYHFVEHNEAK